MPFVFELLAQTVLEQADSLEAERRTLEQCLQKLPDTQRQLITAAYAPGAKIDRLAEQLGRTAMAVYKSLHRLRIQLVECTQRALALEEQA